MIRLYAEPGRGHTDQELADRFEVGREAIFKRRKRLGDEFGLDFVETKRGRYRIDGETFVFNIKVSWEEALILYLAALPADPGAALSHLSDSLTRQLGQTPPTHPHQPRRPTFMPHLPGPDGPPHCQQAWSLSGQAVLGLPRLSQVPGQARG